MLFVVRCLQELGRRKKIPLYMCFVDLKKAYDSVDREMQWKVLARAGIPAKLIKVIRQIHDGVRARLRMVDGELSDWLFVTQGVRQGCVLSPLLFNIFFTRQEAPFRLKIRLLQAEAMEALLYGYMVWPPLSGHYQTLRSIHHQLLLRLIRYKRKKDTYRQLSYYAQTLKKVGCQRVEATIGQRRPLFAGALARQPDGRLPKRLIFGELAGGEKRRRGGQEQNWPK
ncbi:unnamed protein product [Ectocarpus sp. CCAP 1310/34]|nr:unnamed protein product [Ectocarpus sp. CCAP 1310/34]